MASAAMGALVASRLTRPDGATTTLFNLLTLSLFAAPSAAECCFGEASEITRAFRVSS
jgi:hypothetical protein